MRWVKFSERFPTPEDLPSLDADGDVIIRSDGLFCIRGLKELPQVVATEDEWLLQSPESGPGKQCRFCRHFCIDRKVFGYCRKDTPKREGGSSHWPMVKFDDWCSHFDPK